MSPTANTMQTACFVTGQNPMYPVIPHAVQKCTAEQAAMQEPKQGLEDHWDTGIQANVGGMGKQTLHAGVLDHGYTLL